MTEIQIAGEVLEERFAAQDKLTDALDEVINDFPGAVDAGAAAEYVTVLFQSAIEGMANLADTHRALIAVARDVCEDLSTTDSAAADALYDLREEF